MRAEGGEIGRGRTKQGRRAREREVGERAGGRWRGMGIGILEDSLIKTQNVITRHGLQHLGREQHGLYQRKTVDIVRVLRKTDKQIYVFEQFQKTTLRNIHENH